MKKFSEIFMIGLLLMAGFIVVMLIFSSSSGGRSRALPIASFGSRIGLVEVRGVILSSERTVKVINDFRNDGSIKALIVRINSPGGGVVASQEIYEALKRAKEDGIVVVASMSEMAASGGYYVACAADTIIASPGTTTGSLGVILSLAEYSGLYEKIGLKYNNIKSGRFKDIGDSSRPLEKEERKILKAFVDDAYYQFVEVIVDARKELDRDRVLELADGRIYTGKQAMELGLIDELGTFEDALEIAAEMADISGTPDVVRPYKKKVTLFDLLFQDVESILTGLQTLPILRYQLVM